MKSNLQFMMMPNFAKKLFLFAAAIVCLNPNFFAQEVKTPAATTVKPAQIDRAVDAPAVSPVVAQAAQDASRRYRIGAGDELDIQVFRHPELSSSAVRVNEFGVIMLSTLR